MSALRRGCNGLQPAEELLKEERKQWESEQCIYRGAFTSSLLVFFRVSFSLYRDSLFSSLTFHVVLVRANIL